MFAHRTEAAHFRNYSITEVVKLSYQMTSYRRNLYLNIKLRNTKKNTVHKLNGCNYNLLLESVILGIQISFLKNFFFFLFP